MRNVVHAQWRTMHDEPVLRVRLGSFDVPPCVEGAQAGTDTYGSHLTGAVLNPCLRPPIMSSLLDSELVDTAAEQAYTQHCDQAGGLNLAIHGELCEPPSTRLASVQSDPHAADRHSWACYERSVGGMPRGVALCTAGV